MTLSLFRPGLVFAAFSLLLMAGCSGGGGSDQSQANGTAASTGTIGLILTDKPTDEFSAIRLNVIEARLIGDGDQEILFEGSKPIDLLDLTNYNEPIVFGEVRAGTYTKLRLVIDDLELVPLDGGPSIFPRLPANGKIDLLAPDGIPVLPGRTLIADIDMDANKAIKITQAGNSNQYNFRPVVRAVFMDGGLPDKLARIDGVVSEIPATPAGRLVVCDIDVPDNCIDVNTGTATSFFDDQGAMADLGIVAVNDPVVVIGRYLIDGRDISLDAIIVEVGGNAEQLKGEAVSDVVDNRFLLLLDDGSTIDVVLQTGTRYFDADGEIDISAVSIGASLEIEGTQPDKTMPDDPDLIRAALVFVEAPDADQLSGTVIDPLEISARSFGLMPLEGNDTCVFVEEGASILLVDTSASEVAPGALTDLAIGQSVDLFGMTDPVSSCFQAAEVIVEIGSTGT